MPHHLVITDSGLGGLAVCAGIERALRQCGAPPSPRITYVNAWPDEGRGYNDLPDMAARAACFDRALAAIDRLAPDAILIACNTLSIVHAHTAHRARAVVPVHGIVEAGVGLFAEALDAHPHAALVMIGTRTTIDSGVHGAALVARGVSPSRLAGASCHGLATSIERAPFSPATDALIDACAARAAEAAPVGQPLLLGLCCTHYGFVAARLAAALEHRAGRAVTVLDPNARLVEETVSRLARPSEQDPAATPATPLVELISRVTLPEDGRREVARLVEPVSPATAGALLAYRHVPDLF